MASYFYINSSGKKIETTSIINLCETRGMMSYCRAATEEDQKGCKYRVESPQPNVTRCMHYCASINGACDNMYAQKGIDPPKK